MAIYGLIPEFVGRFGYLIEFEALSEADLKDILLDSEESIISNYKQLFEICGDSFALPEDQIEKLVEAAYRSGTGARGLNNAVNSLIKERMFKMSFKPRQTAKR